MTADPVADQKRLALLKLQMFEESVAHSNAEGLDLARLVDPIRQDLLKGLVPPIFHALMSAKTRKNFPSAAPVTAAPPEEVVRPDHPFDMGPRGVNFKLDKILDHGSVPSELEDESRDTLWKYDTQAAQAAAAIVNQKATMLGVGIEMTKVDFLFGVDEKGDKGSNRKDLLLTRIESRGVLAQCHSRLENEANTAAVVGSPGIGKSWLILYALQQALLYEDATVILQASTRNQRYLLVRRKNKIYCWTIACDGLKQASSVLFNLKTTLVLYDPPEIVGNQGGAKYAENERQLIAFLSANAGHATKKSKKTAAGVNHYLGHPTDRELVLMMELLSKDEENARLALERAKVVGNLPRYLLGEKAYEDRIKQLNDAIKKIDNDNDYLLKAIESGGESTLTDTLPGTLFTVYGRERMLELNDSATDDWDDDDETSNSSSPTTTTSAQLTSTLLPTTAPAPQPPMAAAAAQNPTTATATSTNPPSGPTKTENTTMARTKNASKRKVTLSSDQYTVSAETPPQPSTRTMQLQRGRSVGKDASTAKSVNTMQPRKRSRRNIMASEGIRLANLATGPDSLLEPASARAAAAGKTTVHNSNSVFDFDEEEEKEVSSKAVAQISADDAQTSSWSSMEDDAPGDEPTKAEGSKEDDFKNKKETGQETTEAEVNQDDNKEEEEDDDVVLYHPCDYDGDHIDYTDRCVSVLTEAVRQKVVNANREVLLSYWGVIDSGRFAQMGHAVEALFIGDLRRDSVAFRRCRLAKRGENAETGALELNSKPILLDFRDLDEDTVFQRLGEVFADSRNVIVHLKAGFVLIDCAGPGPRVYQITVGDDHSMSLKGMQKLLTAAGYLQEDGEGKLTECYGDVVTAKDILEFYWVVPPARFSVWSKKSPKKYSTAMRGQITPEKQKTIEVKKILNRCLKKWVVQFALEVPMDLGWQTQKRQRGE